ncbi:uncharacterized protein LOC143364671 [Halictus rubicundus]|uniref:uncharacterized protein LOC143364671 n=1 Tax=Halictus rubicundus TaxID=77578 RepID=UPI0040357778
MAKLQFECEMAADEDPKSSTILIKSITDEDGKKFHIPRCYQSYKQHPELIKLPEFKKIINTLKKRGQCRKVWIKLNDESLPLYKDESGNMIVKDFLLEDISTPEQTAPSTSKIQEDETLIKLLEKLGGREKPAEESKDRNLNKLCGKFVLDKFEGKKVNANQWLQTYESECDRLNIESDVEKIEALRLFLDDAVKDWFNSMLIKHTLNSEWRTWKEKFLQTFADKGWSSVTYAVNNKYFTGSILEYALKKERLLLESNKNMDDRILVDLIAEGLPTFVRNKIDRQDTTTPVKLFSELRKYENIGKKSNKIMKTEARSNLKQPCKICESKGNKNRYHPEELCWFKEDRNKSIEKKRITNTILEIDNTEDPKN